MDAGAAEMRSSQAGARVSTKALVAGRRKIDANVMNSVLDITSIESISEFHPDF